MWFRLPFGLKLCSEIFQKRLHRALEGLPGARCIADYVIIWGRSDGEEHDTRVHQFLTCCCDTGISLNKEKCRFGLTEIPYMGHVVSNESLKLDPTKIDAVLKMKTPTDKAAVERLDYQSLRIVPRISKVMRPINTFNPTMTLSGHRTACRTKRLKS